MVLGPFENLTNLVPDPLLLGSPIGSSIFAKQYFNEQLNQVQQYISLMTTAMLDSHSRLQISSQCLIQKLPHLLGSNVLHHYNITNPPPIWTDWNGPLTSTTNKIIESFLATLLTLLNIPQHTLLISQPPLNNGGLGMLEPRSSAIPDFMLIFTTSTPQVTKGIYLNKHLANPLLHTTLSDLYSLDRNPTSLILQ
jgi:hypothetical protein